MPTRLRPDPLTTLALLCATSTVLAQDTRTTQRTTTATRIVAHMIAGRFDSAVVMFAPRLREEISATRLRDTWASLTNALGAVQGVNPVRDEGAEVVVPVGFRTFDLHVAFTMDTAARATSLALRPNRRVRPDTVPPPAPATPAPLPDDAFARGDFVAAKREATQHLARDPASARLRLASLALLQNKPGAALDHLRFLDVPPTRERERNGLVAEAYSRLRNYQAAAEAYRAMGRVAIAAKYASFGAQVPYAHTFTDPIVRVPFERTDPLPVVGVRVNGQAPRYFLIDTGAGETILDSAFATAVGARRFGADSAAFAGGNRTSIEHGTIESLQLGTLQLNNLPVRIQPTRLFSLAGGGLPIDGIIGTGLFRELNATIDYPKGELRLAPRGSQRQAATGATEVPMWLAADHFMLAWGRTSDADSSLMLLDTGLVGSTFVAPDTVFRLVGIPATAGEEVTGVGGAGSVTARVVTLPRVTFAGITERDVPAMMGVFPPTLEHQFGFPIRGLISHAFLRKHAVTFDFDAMKVVLTPMH